MSYQIPCTYFYLPEAYWQIEDDLMSVLDCYLKGGMNLSDLWEWHTRTHPSLKSDGLFAWIVQPYLYLKGRGFFCELTSEIPSQGIVILPRKFVEDDLKPSSGCLFIMAKSDCKVLKYAHIHIVENIYEDLIQRPSNLWKSYFVPHFPQPGLMPRDPQHGDRFENVIYAGLESNLDPQLRTAKWKERLAKLDFNWQVLDRSHWHKYTDADVIVAVRSFDKCTYNWKPASKLYNAWCAGVPAILGPESSFQSERKSELDYIEVKSASEIIEALLLLRDNKELRQRIINNGKERSITRHPNVVANHWANLITKYAYPYYDEWTSSSKFHHGFFILARDYDTALRKQVLPKCRRFRGQIKQFFKRNFLSLK
jgi:hypothetical protein